MPSEDREQAAHESYLLKRSKLREKHVSSHIYLAKIMHTEIVSQSRFYGMSVSGMSTTTYRRILAARRSGGSVSVEEVLCRAVYFDDRHSKSEPGYDEVEARFDADIIRSVLLAVCKNQKFMRAYLDPDGSTYLNARASARDVGYERNAAFADLWRSMDALDRILEAMRDGKVSASSVMLWAKERMKRDPN